MREASTDASPNKNLEEEIRTETNPIEETEPKIATDLNRKNKEKKKVDELPEMYRPKVPFSSALEVGSSSLESPFPSELKSSSVTLENICLESNGILPVSIASNLTPKLKS